jgi:hypothetical protein
MSGSIKWSRCSVTEALLKDTAMGFPETLEDRWMSRAQSIKRINVADHCCSLIVCGNTI